MLARPCAFRWSRCGVAAGLLLAGVARLGAQDTGTLLPDVGHGWMSDGSGNIRMAGVPPSPAFVTLQAADGPVPEGSSATLTAAVSGPELIQWQHDGIDVPGATEQTLTLPFVSSSDAGQYTVVSTNVFGSSTSNPVELAVIPAGRAGRLSSFSTVMPLDGTNPDSSLVVGITGGSGTKPLLIRAIGPSLARFGMNGRISNPRIEVYRGTTKLAAAAGWNGEPIASEAAARVGAFPLEASSADAALVLEAPTGTAPWMRISDVNDASGVVLAEVYDATPTATIDGLTPRLVSFAVRTTVAASANLATGFVVAGRTPVTVLVRAVGPSLATTGTITPMPDPTLTLMQGSAAIAHNSGWADAANVAAAAQAVGAAPLSAGSNDAAMLLMLEPGSYIAQAASSGNFGGAVRLEIYEVR